MRTQEIIGMVRENFFLAILALLLVGVVFFIWYFIVYRKLLKGNKSLPMKQLFFAVLFIGYVIMVIGVTFLNRGSNFHSGMNVSLFYTYREAWYNFSVRHWQFIILNIVMLVPFGILLPLLHTRFKRASWTIGLALLFTLSIESLQFITGYGLFDVDDLLNNLLGAVIGYGIFMGLITIKEKGVKRSFPYFTPLLLVMILFGGIFTYYQLKEFGNLSIVAIQRTSMTTATTNIDVQLDDHRKKVPIYRAPSYSKAAADEFVIDFFNKLTINTSNMEVITYPDLGIYWVGDERSHNIGFDFLDGGYHYTDFSSFNEGMELKDVDEDTLKGKLKQFEIDISQDSHFQRIDTGTYEWIVDKKKMGSQLIDGSLKVNYYNDDTVKSIDNQLITYDEVRDVQVKSEQEAYKEVLDGNFQYHSGDQKIETLQVESVELSYHLDSKGYYQPVYAFHSKVNGMEMTILIPGI